MSVSALRRPAETESQNSEVIVPVFECQYHHITVAQKRKSDLSFSVSGADLRRKRRQIIVDDTASQKTIICPVLKEKYGDLRWKICNNGYDFFKSISSSFHAFGSHQFIKDSALLLLNPLRDQSIFYFISSPFRNLTLTWHIISV